MFHLSRVLSGCQNIAETEARLNELSALLRKEQEQAPNCQPFYAPLSAAESVSNLLSAKRTGQPTFHSRSFHGVSGWLQKKQYTADDSIQDIFRQAEIALGRPLDISEGIIRGTWRTFLLPLPLKWTRAAANAT